MMDSSKKVTDFKKILSTITDPPQQKAEGVSKPSSKLSLGLGVRPPLCSLPLTSPSNRTVAHKLDFSDESALLNNSSAMEITACTPPPSLAGSKRKVDQERLLKEGELTHAQGKIVSLTNELETERNLKKRLKVEQEKEIRDAQADKIAFEMRNKDLLDKLRRLEQAKNAADKTSSRAIETSRCDRASLESEKRQLDLVVSQLKTDNQEMKNALDHAHGDIDRLNDSAEYLKEDMDMQIEELQEASRNDRDRIERLQDEVDELRGCRNAAVEAENKIVDLNHQIRLLEEEAQLGKLFKEQSGEIRKLQLANDELSERNRILSMTQEDTSVLQEKLRSANSKIKRTEERIQDMTRLNLEITKLRGSLSEWESVLSEVLPSVGGARGGGARVSGSALNTDSLRQYLAKTQHDLLFASEQRQKIELELGSTQDSELRVSEEMRQLQSTLEREQHKVKNQQELLIKLRKKYQLITKERDSYRSVLNSYESEMTTNPGDVDRKRLEDLEEVLEGYRREVDKEFAAMPSLGKALPIQISVEPQQNQQQQHQSRAVDGESGEVMAIDPPSNAVVDAGETEVVAPEVVAPEVAAAAVVANPQPGMVSEKLLAEKEEEWRSEMEDLKGKMKIIEEENEELKRVNETLRQESTRLNDYMEEQKMKGDFDPTNTKVVHLRFNPFEMMKQKKLDDVKALKEENERLLTRVRMLEAGVKEGQSLSEGEIKESRTMATTSKEVEDMKAQINNAHLKNQRLVEAFQKTSLDFREAVFRLFGYKLDSPVSKQYKLMSMYADSPGDFLLFSQSSSGEMQLLETEFSDSLSDLIDAYLSQADSIPAFLASVTMDLFNKQTIA